MYTRGRVSELRVSSKCQLVSSVSHSLHTLTRSQATGAGVIGDNHISMIPALAWPAICPGIPLHMKHKPRLVTLLLENSAISEIVERISIYCLSSDASVEYLSGRTGCCLSLSVIG